MQIFCVKIFTDLRKKIDILLSTFKKIDKSFRLGFLTKNTLLNRGGVLEDRFWSPWPWPRGLKSSKIGLFFDFIKALEKFFGKLFFVEIGWKIFVKTFFFWRSPEKFLWRPFFFFFWRALALVSLVLGLGLEHSCPWPRECLSSERLSLALDFFCVLGLGLGLEPCVFDSTSAFKMSKKQLFQKFYKWKTTI